MIDELFDLAIASRALTDRERLLDFKARIEELLRHKLQILIEDSQVIAVDMEGVLLRLQAHGHRALLSDIPTERWHCTRDTIVALRLIYSFLCCSLGLQESPDLAVEQP